MVFFFLLPLHLVESFIYICTVSTSNPYKMSHSDSQIFQDMLCYYFRGNVEKTEWAWRFKNTTPHGSHVEFVYRGAVAWETPNHAEVFDLCGTLAIMHQHKYIEAQVIEHYSIGFDPQGNYGCGFIIEAL